MTRKKHRQNQNIAFKKENNIKVTRYTSTNNNRFKRTDSMKKTNI